MTIVIAICGLWMLAAGPAIAAGKSVAEEILDVLRASGQITEQQYGMLLEKARSEQQTLPAVSAAEKPETFRVYWKNGLRFDSADKQFKLKIGGRIMNDWAWIDEDSDFTAGGGSADYDNNTQFRRARLYMAGTIYGNMGFKAQYDFEDGVADFKDMYIELKKVPTLGHVRVGHFKEPYSLEELTSSKYITFMERSLPTTFAPSRNTGLMIHNHAMDQRMTWAAGVFREADAFGETTRGLDDDTYNVTGRITALPWYVDEGRNLLHVGLSYSHKFRDDDDFGESTKPEADLVSTLAGATVSDSDGIDLITPELALVLGPFSLQGEYTKAYVEGSNIDWEGFYAQASYFLTGEHRKYKRTAGSFSRVSPRENFDMNGGKGAWEIAVRYSHIDFFDGGLTEEKLSDITVGLNWHLNPNVRMMLNYVRGNLDQFGIEDSDGDILQTRFQVDF
jgi:phosphate-selective porin OprO/OprP